MADHIRKQLREAVATAVTGLATTATKVFQSRVYPLQDADLPALRVFTRSESASPQTLKIPTLVARTVEIIIEGAAKANADLDDTLDQIAKEVETALGLGVTAGGKFVPLSYAGCDVDLSGESEQPIGMIALRYEAKLLSRADTPDLFA